MDFSEANEITRHAIYTQNHFNQKVKNLEPDQKLLHHLYIYGKDNLAMIHVMIQSPYVTKIKRDVAMSFTNYVANTGGLLGLCLGFSFISILEILFWCCMAFKKIIN